MAVRPPAVTPRGTRRSRRGESAKGASSAERRAGGPGRATSVRRPRLCAEVASSARRAHTFRSTTFVEEIVPLLRRRVHNHGVSRRLGVRARTDRGFLSWKRRALHVFLNRLSRDLPPSSRILLLPLRDPRARKDLRRRSDARTRDVIEHLRGDRRVRGQPPATDPRARPAARRSRSVRPITNRG